MNERYEHAGRPFNKPIIRDILTNKLPPPLEWLSIEDLNESILQYHLRNGGKPPRILNSYGPTREVLVELCEAGRIEKGKFGRRITFRTPPSGSPVERLIQMLKHERNRIKAEIQPLENRLAAIDVLLTELTSHGSPDNES